MIINRELFVLKDIPKLHPLSTEYIEYWREQKRRCIEGHWEGGFWMPGNLYFYINFWHILLNKTEHSKTKIIERPLLRDVEWEMVQGFVRARGLTGFTSAPSLTEDELLDVFTNGSRVGSLGKPLYNKESRDYMIMGARGFGKELADYEPVITDSGYKNICDVVIGENIYGKDGKLASVTGVYPQGLKDIYRLELVDGRYIDCGLEHQWQVYQGRTHKRILTTKDLLSKNLTHKHKKSGTSYNFSLPVNEPVEFEHKELPIDPYLLGLLIGDGTTTTLTPKISTNDLEIVEWLVKNLPDFEVKLDKSTNNYTIVYRGSDKYGPNNKYGYNKLHKQIKELGLDVKCYEKFIPEIYKHSSIEQRFELLRGLLDTDGSINNEGSIEFTSVCKQLVDDIAYLIRSLGISCQVGTDKRAGQMHMLPQGTTHIRGLYYRVFIKTDKPVFKLTRKLNRIKKRSVNNLVSIKGITKLPEQHTATCITVDNNDHLFLTRDFVVTHNSFFVAGAIIAHEWLFDGAKEYIPADDENYRRTSTEVVVGAGDAKYSGLLLKKVELGLNTLQGGINIYGENYPAPFYKQYSGSFNANKDIIAQYEKRYLGQKKIEGSGSTIKHRTFKDNPFAANGTRGAVNVREECGLFKGLEASYQASRETMMNGNYKFGTCVYLGTGGDMDEGTLDSYKMFYNPETYDLITYEDVWENKGKIGYFMPAYKALNQYKDENGFTKEQEARDYLNKYRETLKKKTSSSSVLDAELQNRPLVPSEVFLRTNGNIFPVAEMKEWLGELETKSIYRDAEFIGELVFSDEGEVQWRNNRDVRPLRKFPLEKHDDATGGITIFHHPESDNNLGETSIPYGRYIAGIDPYDQDKANASSSLGSIVVIDKLTSTLVCEYSGRPKSIYELYETFRKILMYYNAIALYENEKPGLKQYFEAKGCLHLLMKQPKYIKDVIPNSTVERMYGMHAAEALRDHGEILVREFLNAEFEPGKSNVRRIRSVPLLQELIMYDDKGNFDRCDAIIFCMYAIAETRKQKILYIKDEQFKDPFFTRKLFKKNSYTTN